MVKKDSGKTDLTAAFQQLRQRFALGLPQRSAAMVSLIEQCDVQNALAELIAQAHKLAGACGTFGFAVLGNHARQIEQLAGVIRDKVAEEQEQSLPALKRAVLEFDIAVAKALQTDSQTEDSADDSLLEQNTIWLLLDNPDLVTELTSQLTAFGHKVEHFIDFDSCVKRLQSAAPAVLFSAITLSNSKTLFNQKLLLSQLVKHNSRLMLFSETDSFELRIKAAQQRVDAFFVSPLDVPSMIATMTELLEYSAGTPGRVFIVDDDKLLAEHYALVLKSIGVETQILENVHNIVNELMRFQPDLLLMDMYMPDYSGTELAGLIRQYRSLKRLPIVFLSSEANKLLQIRAMAHGADDFLTKPIDDTQLAQLIKIRLTRSMQIKNLIEKDSLTALVKHSAIKEMAELEFERAGRNKKPLSIVMLDIDHFKAVNDSYGHATGDVVITALATMLRKRIRKTDRAGRYGGEEFMLVLPDCDSNQACILVEKILHAFRMLHFNSGGKQFYCTFSAGVASSNDSDFTNAEQMVAAADKALYRAKHDGRDKVCR
jgi:diguanylate cyclase (GGDEF)-like protein